MERRGQTEPRYELSQLVRACGVVVALVVAGACTSSSDGVSPPSSSSSSSSPATSEPVFDLARDAALTLPDGTGEPCEADDVAGIRVTDECVDPELAVPFIDEDEIREVDEPETGDALSYRYLHGGFEDSPVRFSLHFPLEYRGRFYQSTYPTIGTEQVADDRIAHGLRNGAAVVASNNAGGVAASPALGGVRANAGAAKIARHLIPQLYGGEAPARGYVYGASGGAYQTIGALESTTGVWDGGVPIVPGTSNAIPSFMTVQLLGLRALADDLPAIVDAVEPGGSGDPFADLDTEAQAVLEEVTRLGFPLGGWWQHESLKGGAFGIVQLAVRGIDPGYADDFWSVPGYEGADPESPIHAGRIQHETTVAAVDGQTVTLGEPAPADAFGADLVVLGGGAEGEESSVADADGAQVTLEDPIDGLAPGDPVRVDNSWFLAMHYYHRHQVPDADQYAWDVLRNDDGTPIHPQRPSLVGPVIADVFGSLQTGEYAGRMIVVASMKDVEAFPWAADWYAQRVVGALGDDVDGRFRLWYLENADHVPRSDPTHTIDYSGVVEQALLDLDAWVANGVEPPASTSYEIGDLSEIVVPPDAAERRGVQPAVRLGAGTSGCGDANDRRVDVSSGDEVAFSVTAATPPAAGSVVDVEWDFDGSGEFAGEGGGFDVGETITACATHRFRTPGTHFATVRVTSHRDGDPDAVDGRISNLARVRVVVS